MNIRDLKYLISVADHKHFGNAAKACFVSQPTLSMQIKKLEQELGAQLLERGNKQVTLTPAGTKIVSQARIVLTELQQLKALAKSYNDPLSGDFKLGLIPTVGPYLLPLIHKKLRQQLPNLNLYFYEAKTDNLLKQLKQAKLDAIILALPTASADFTVQPLFTEPFYVAMAVDHTLTRKKQIQHSDLNKQTILLLEEGHCLRDQALAVCNLTASQQIANFKATSLETLRYMVASGTGITLLPALATQTNNSNNGITIRPFRKPVPSRDIAMLWRKNASRLQCFKTIAAITTAQINTPFLLSINGCDYEC